MGDTTNRLAGTANLSVDGANYMLAGEFEYSSSDVKRETLSGQDQVHGYSEMPLAPFIAATLRDSDGLKVSDLNAMTNVTVVAELANGKLISGRNMWTVESQSSKTTESTIEVRWEGLNGSVTEN